MKLKKKQTIIQQNAIVHNMSYQCCANYLHRIITFKRKVINILQFKQTHERMNT